MKELHYKVPIIHEYYFSKIFLSLRKQDISYIGTSIKVVSAMSHAINISAMD